jgi:hypothetical protein
MKPNKNALTRSVLMAVMILFGFLRSRYLPASASYSNGPLPMLLPVQTPASQCDCDTLVAENQRLSQANQELQTSLSSLQGIAIGLSCASMFLLGAVIVIFVARRPAGSKTTSSHPTQRLDPNITRGEEVSFVRTLIGQGASNVDFLEEMVRIQYYFQQKRRVPENAAYLARDFLKMAERYLDIRPIENYGSQIRFDPARHRSYESPREGDLVWVAQPGWQRKGQILKYPVVQTNKEAV